MRIGFETIQLNTGERLQLLDITKRVRDCLLKHPVRNGMLILNALHTTVALFVNEFQTALIEDTKTILSRLVRQGDGYRHDDPRFSDCDRRNADSHLRAMFLGQNVIVPIQGGEMVLGKWQSIILAELDGPRERSIQVQIVGE
ncbi:MAG: YjbQ family protein [candidate division NC10 bacterium]|jgi:secondary thiamine-phosphate synthase enzyme|nr:YjbQ family protein [candidate division NC10 bacterium]MBI4391719.1 YjbQ family protein [candidate division NC10 bacterium]